MQPLLLERLQRRLEERRAADIYRCRQVLGGPQGPRVWLQGHELLSFDSNDYLGLAADPRVIAACRRGLETWGLGSGSAHLVSGHSAAHHALEEELAAFVGRPRALLFSTGYMANLGVITALLGRHDHLLQDRHNHASLLDAGQCSRARMRRYPHRDPAALGRLLAQTPPGAGCLVATDGVFSMDGTTAPLADLAALCRAQGAMLMVDDAHGLGVQGPDGRGSLAAAGLGLDDVPVLMGTLGKALGVQGAFVAGSEGLIEGLIQEARSYVYTTAPPAALAEATRESLRLVAHEAWRRDQLDSLVNRFRAGASALGLRLSASAGPIQPVLLGTAARALRASRCLREHGLLVTAIRPPTVPEGGARLRVSFSARHTAADVDRLLEALAVCVANAPDAEPPVPLPATPAEGRHHAA